MPLKKKIYLIERINRNKVTLICAARNLKAGYSLSKLHGYLADPDISYKTLVRRLDKVDSIIIYDRNRFETEDEAKYSLVGDVVRITRTILI